MRTSVASCDYIAATTNLSIRVLKKICPIVLIHTCNDLPHKRNLLLRSLWSGL